MIESIPTMENHNNNMEEGHGCHHHSDQEEVSNDHYDLLRCMGNIHAKKMLKIECIGAIEDVGETCPSTGFLVTVALINGSMLFLPLDMMDIFMFLKCNAPFLSIIQHLGQSHGTIYAIGPCWKC